MKCPCGSAKLYKDCCSDYLAGKKLPEQPEELMRSRYTAYTQANIDYIVSTMKAPASNDFDAEDARNWAKTIRWIKLEVIKASTYSDRGVVEFMATFEEKNKRYAIHEVSEFQMVDGKWFYVDGKMVA